MTAGDAGWAVGPSLAEELSAALSLVGPTGALLGVSAQAAALRVAAPADWLAAWPSMLGAGGAGLDALSLLADLAGVLTASEYDGATLPMRDLSLAAGLERLAALGAPHGVTPDAALAPPARLADLALRATAATYAAVGLRPEPEYAARLARTCAWLPQVLRDGDRHGPFWLWLDRFYYTVYGPWRAGRRAVLETLTQEALAALGAESGTAPPPLAWLPAPNPLVRVPALRQAVAAGALPVYFWVEPFGLVDAWHLLPDRLVVSCARAADLGAQLAEAASGVAARSAALGDPTRLIILRLIRHFGMINTEIAAYLEISRPTVSVHAKILREAGLIESHPAGREMRHAIRPGAIRGLFRDLERFLDFPPEEAGEE